MSAQGDGGDGAPVWQPWQPTWQTCDCRWCGEPGAGPECDACAAASPRDRLSAGVQALFLEAVEAGDQHAAGVLQDALDLLRESASGAPACSSHTWRTPAPGDAALTCDTCGASRLFETLAPRTVAAVIAQHEGDRESFAVSLAAALHSLARTAEDARPPAAPRLVGWITREHVFTAEHGDTPMIERSGGDLEPFEPGSAADTCTPIYETPDGRYCDAQGAPATGPACSDCGGLLVWAENGRVPGSRECSICHAHWSDSRYGCAHERHRCPVHPEGI